MKKSTRSCLIPAAFLFSIGTIANIGSCGKKQDNPPRTSESTKEARSLPDDSTPAKPLEAVSTLLERVDPTPASRPNTEPPTRTEEQVSTPALHPSTTLTTTAAPAPAAVPVTAWAVSSLFPTPQRKWTSADGKTALGSVTRYDPVSGILSLRTASSETFDGLLLSRFSDEDQKYVRAAAEGRLVGKVVGVSDGDSLTLLVGGNTQIRVRLESIDAPEIGQEYGNNAKEELSRLVHAKEIDVRVSGLDKYKRTLGWVRCPDGTNVNLALVTAGLAWNYVEYSKSAELVAAERAAREAKRGLWKDWKPMSPWDWRDLQRENAGRKAAQTTPNPFSSSGTGSTSTGGASRVIEQKPVAGSFWLNTSSNKRHNRSCRYFGGTKNGRACGPTEGSACGTCGG